MAKTKVTHGKVRSPNRSFQILVCRNGQLYAIVKSNDKQED